MDEKVTWKCDICGNEEQTEDEYDVPKNWRRARDMFQFYVTDEEYTYMCERCADKYRAVLERFYKTGE